LAPEFTHFTPEKYIIILTWQDHVIANVDQCDRLVGREVSGRPEFDCHRIFQRAGDATASPICSRSTVPGKHGSEDVVRPRATYHVRDECVSGNQAHIVRHLRCAIAKS